MDLDYSQIITGLTSGGGGVIATGLFLRAWFSGVMTEMKDLRNEVRTLREEKVGDLSRRVGAIEAARKCELHEQRFDQFEKDVTGVKQATAGIAAIKESVDTTRGNVAKIFMWLERDAKDLASVGTKIDMLLKKEGLL